MVKSVVILCRGDRAYAVRLSSGRWRCTACGKVVKVVA